MTLTTTALWIAGGLIATSLVTFALPRHVRVERTALLEATPESVLALAGSNSGYQRFNPYKTRDPELKIDLYGPETGVGSGFRFDGKEGKGQQTVADVTNDTVTYAIDLGAMDQPTQAIHAVQADKGTHVTWRVESDMGFNPVFRVFGLFMERMMGPTMEQGLENLRRAAA
ncbi:SRPBCC family protein [Roseobacter sinensis]|uniref:SRPBCC family protein n=1 Tax=Roseobacter sinensis TaxID=2931391 RepID=A0ABT3BJT0_9RHOB|nr:SRPBCC family protein [Roseobacter sp. WL0113]MCV3273838.1 SRPBCC family protein [Roseobacter sp. WL0113]